MSLIDLNPSRSMKSSDSGRPLRDGALGFPPQHLRQIPRVVERRQVVGDRQRFGALHPQRVVERDRAGLDGRLERRLRRAGSRGSPLETAGDRARRRAPTVRPRQVSGNPSAAHAVRAGERRSVERSADANGVAGANDQARDRLRPPARRRRRAPRDGHRPHAAALSVGRQPSASRGRGSRPPGVLEHRVGDAVRIEAGVDRADHVREGRRRATAAAEAAPGAAAAARRGPDACGGGRPEPASWTTGARLPTSPGQSALRPIGMTDASKSFYPPKI